MTQPVTPKSPEQIAQEYKTAVNTAESMLTQGHVTWSEYYHNEVTAQDSTVWKVLGFVKVALRATIGLVPCFIFDRIFGYDATCSEYVKTRDTLIQAVAARALSPQERANLPQHAGKLVISQADDISNLEKDQAVEDAQKAFYKVFKTRCEQLGVTNDGEKYAIHHAAAMQGIAKLSPETNSMKAKLETLNQIGQGKVFTDIVETFAKLPATSITVDSYKKLTTDLKKSKLGENMSEEAIATAVRTAIKKLPIHQGDAFTKLAAAFADTNSVEYKTLLAGLRTKLDKEQKDLEVELGALCGPAGNNGTVHTAWKTKDDAEKALALAEKAFRDHFGVTSTSPIDDLLALNFDLTPAKAARDAYVAKKTEFDAAAKALKALEDKMNELGQWTNGQLSGGKVFNAQLNAGSNFNTVVANAANQLAAFYAEVNIAITGDAALRQQTMKAITG